MSSHLIAIVFKHDKTLVPFNVDPLLQKTPQFWTSASCPCGTLKKGSIFSFAQVNPSPTSATLAKDKQLIFSGIHTVEELSNRDATALFHELERRTQTRQDPCVWDVFAAIIHEASGGKPAVWWELTSKRKSLQKKVC